MKKVDVPEESDYFRRHKATLAAVNELYLKTKEEVEQKELHAYLKADGELDIFQLERSASITANDVATLGAYRMIREVHSKVANHKTHESDLKIPKKLKHTLQGIMGDIEVDVLTGVVTNNGEELPKEQAHEIVQQLLKEMEKENE